MMLVPSCPGKVFQERGPSGLKEWIKLLLGDQVHSAIALCPVLWVEVPLKSLAVYSSNTWNIL